MRMAGLTIYVSIVLALALRVLVPTGWMPAPSGGFALIPCVAVQAPPEAHHGGHHAGHEKQPQEQDRDVSNDCAFAPLLAGSAVPASLAAKVAPPFTSRVRIDRRIENAALPTGPPSPPPPSTGPPTLA